MLAGPVLAAMAGAGAAGALVDRLIGPGLDWWHWVAWPVGAGVALAAGLTLARRQRFDHAAIEVDTALRLHDRLGSALSLSAKGNGDPFIALTVLDAERAAGGVDVGRAIPIRWGRSWQAWPMLSAVAAAIGFLVEPMHLLDAGAVGPRIVFNPESVQEAREAIEDAAEAMKPEDGAASSDASDDKRRQVLDELSRELTNEGSSPDEALSKAASVLEEAAAEANAEAKASQASADELREALAGLPGEEQGEEAGDGAKGTPTGDLREALRQGSFDEASKSLDELRRQMEMMPRSQREALAEELEALSDDLKQRAEQQKQDAERRGESAREDLKEQGLTEDQAEPIAEESDEKKIEEALRKEGFGEESARQFAKELAEERRRRDAEEQAAKQAKELSDAAKQAADEVRESQERNAKPSEQGGEREAKDKQEPGAPREQGQREKDGDQQGKQPEGGDESSPTQTSPPTPGVEAPGAPREQQGQQQQQEGQQPPGTRKPESGGQCENPGQTPGTSPDSSAPPQGAPGPDAINQMKHLLEQMQRQQNKGGSQAQRSNELREQARALLDKSSPEQREQWRKWAEQAVREQEDNSALGGRSAGTGGGGNPPVRPSETGPRTEDVDWRRRGEKERVAAEWTSPRATQPDRTISRRDFEQQLQDAREAAQKAMEEQTIPARYRNVQEFYKRALKKQQEGQPEPPKPPAPAAEDAKKDETEKK